MAQTTPDRGVRGPAEHPAHARRGTGRDGGAPRGSAPHTHPGGQGRPGAGDAAAAAAPMTHRQIMEALSGLLLGMFVAILSSTIVTNALPEIINDLHGSQSSYTWVVTAALLSMTATTPLWGKLADLFSKKLLVQTSLVIYVGGSVVAGLSQNTAMLIACRVVQGVGVGGLSALAQIAMAAMIAPRDRGRYSGYLGATYAVATVAGPLLGGVITDTAWLGWRWCFYVGVPFAVIALVVLQKTLKLPVVRRDVKVDWAGAFFISAAVSLLLIWVTLAGDDYPWLSWQTYAMVGGSAVLGAVFVLVESRAREPIVPLRLFGNRTIALASVASLCVGVAMFAGTVFFSQYFQLARGESPTMSGIMTIPMIAGLSVASTVSGRFITRTGRWKVWLIAGGVLLTAGLGLLGTMRYDTPYWHLACYMALLGLGVGMMMQNLVLATQNQVAPHDLGAASSLVTFFRSLGGAVGVSALGALLANRVGHYTADSGLRGGGGSGGGIPDLDLLPAPVRSVVESAYGHGVADVYLYAAPVALAALLVTLFIKEVALKTHAAGAQPTATSEPTAVPQAGTGTGTGGRAAGVPEPVHPLAGVPAAGPSAPGGGAAPRWAVHDGPPAAAASADGPGSLDRPDGHRPRQGVHGFVRGADGAAVPRAAVTLVSLGGQQLARAVAHPDGSYALGPPGPGGYVLIAAADGHQPQASTVVVGEEPLGFDIVLAGTGSLAGTVRAAGGQPVEAATVVVADVRGEVLISGQTGGRGDFAFAGLGSGTFTVAVNAPGFRPAAVPAEVGAHGVTRLEIALGAGARLRGVVRADGPEGPRPLPDARVTLIDAAGNVVATATTGEDGAYAFADLEAGDYTVVAGGYPPVATALAVPEDGVDGHEVVLGHPDD
ncbi:MFS transporter [Streptomyces sp. B1866]|uniref:MFS transporter n=1 Tax=Streptomyces sp. B1866 TaxID=3075431 RepID=UPI00288C84EA|nr:MFS transporter [Streptomyces sp. B1866]MDT3396470.1 MFS transporter [Streptomyces sp. B1866]